MLCKQQNEYAKTRNKNDTVLPSVKMKYVVHCYDWSARTNEPHVTSGNLSSSIRQLPVLPGSRSSKPRYLPYATAV